MSTTSKIFVVIGTIVALVVASFAIMIWGFGIEMFGLKLQKPIENARTDVTRSTNQYVTTQQQIMLKYAKEYNDAKADGADAQATMLAGQIQSIAATLDKDKIPNSVTVILTNEGMNP